MNSMAMTVHHFFSPRCRRFQREGGHEWRLRRGEQARLHLNGGVVDGLELASASLDSLQLKLRHLPPRPDNLFESKKNFMTSSNGKNEPAPPPDQRERETSSVLRG